MVGDEVFDDPCPGTKKYLNIGYECVPYSKWYAVILFTARITENDLSADAGLVLEWRSTGSITKRGDIIYSPMHYSHDSHKSLGQCFLTPGLDLKLSLGLI